MPNLSSIYAYPLKSGAAVSHPSSVVQRRGLVTDRRFMVIGADNKFVTGRQQPRMTLVRVLADKDRSTFEAPGMPVLEIVHPVAGERVDTAVWDVAVQPLLAPAHANAWISTFLGMDCRIVYMDENCIRAVKSQYDGRYGRDDDVTSLADAFPLLLVTQSSLDVLNSKLAAPVPVLRFRPNLVVDGTLPHAEDGWKRIRIGTTEFELMKPCVRCVFLTVDTVHGAFDPTREPLRTLLTYRRTPDGVTFGQYLVPRRLGVVHVGDAVDVLA